MSKKPIEYTVRECHGFYVVEYEYIDYVLGFWPVRLRQTVGTHDTLREAYDAILSGDYGQ